MAKSEFSETQFVFGFLAEKFLQQNQHPNLFPFWEYFLFPSTFLERELPVDFLADFYTHSEYYQFKRSSFLQRRGQREISEGVPITYLDYYRFKIYNRTSATQRGQFEKLVELAARFPSDLVCYCAPCFHTELEFHHHFQNRSIIANSIIIDCQQFTQGTFQPPNFNINDGLKHYMVYKLGTNVGYLCSEPKEINILNAKERARKIIKKNRPLKEIISILYNDFYLKDEIEGNFKKVDTESFNEQFKLVSNYLFLYYNIIWQPIFRNS